MGLWWQRWVVRSLSRDPVAKPTVEGWYEEERCRGRRMKNENGMERSEREEKP